MPDHLDGSVVMYTLTESSRQFTFAEFIAGPDCCKINYDYKVVGEKGKQIVQNWNSINRTFTFEYMKDDLLPLNDDVFQESQDYLIIITASTGLKNRIESTAVFTLEVLNPCSAIAKVPEKQKPEYCQLIPRLYFSEDLPPFSITNGEYSYYSLPSIVVA